jgi:hypothetical protein
MRGAGFLFEKEQVRRVFSVLRERYAYVALRCARLLVARCDLDLRVCVQPPARRVHSFGSLALPSR